MRPHFIGDYPIDCHPNLDADEFVSAPSATIFNRWQWLNLAWRVRVDLVAFGNHLVGEEPFVIDGSDNVLIPPRSGYTNELEKVCPLNTRINIQPLDATFPNSSFFADWNGSGDVSYIDGVEVAWAMHCDVFFTPDTVTLLKNSNFVGSTLQTDAFLYFDGIQFPLYSTSTDPSDFTGEIRIEPTVTGGFWEHRRANETHPIWDADDGSQLIFDAAELNIR